MSLHLPLSILVLSGYISVLSHRFQTACSQEYLTLSGLFTLVKDLVLAYVQVGMQTFLH
jgi:hypothetical protein